MRALAALAFALATASPAVAATIEARVADARGHAVPDAVIYAIPAGRTLPLAKKTAIMDQKNRMFIPHVLPVQVGTAVRFPNSDDIRHQVYSFSPAKTFQLPLYAGTPATPLVFDKAGVVTLGCNIHDQMNAFIVVVDTPYFEKTSADGRVTLDDLESGRYTLHAWYPDMRTEPQPQSVTLKGDERITVSFVSHGRS
jgi:plastocyanin